MDNSVIVAILSLVGTLIGSLFGILAANKMIIYRIEQLEKKVNKHNNLIERTFALEKAEELIEEKLRVANHRIDNLEQYHK